MADGTCIIKNPLQRNGTSQRERLLKALLPSFVSVDERKTEDLLVYAAKLAEQINFFTLQNQLDGTWKEFFENDISTIVSFIAVKDPAELSDGYHQLEDDFQGNPNKANFKQLFDYIITMGLDIDNWYLRAPVGITFKSDLLKFIQGSLRAELVQLIAYDKAAESLFPPDQFNSVQKPKYEKFSPVWGLDIDAIDPDFSIYQGLTDNAKRKKAADFVTIIYESFYKVEKYIIDRGDVYLNETLEKVSDHAPHIGLFITFIQIFKNAQDHINTLTERHLNFYYEEVLRLLPKNEVPDQVNVIFELAKNINSHLLTRGTLLNAGKDSTNADIVFALEDEIVVNKAQIESLRTSFYAIPESQQKLKQTTPSVLALKNILIAPIANSKNGLGEKLDTGQSWATLGEDQDKLPLGSDPTMIEANVGFAVASPILVLNDGVRIIHLKITLHQVVVLPFVDSIFLVNLKNNLRFFLSGEKGYIEKKAYEIQMNIVGQTLTDFTFVIRLDLDEPAVVNYNAALFNDGYNTTWPLLKMLISNYDYIYNGTVADFVPGHTYAVKNYVVFRQSIYKCLEITTDSPDESPSDWFEFDTFKDYYEDAYNGKVPDDIQMFNVYDMLRSFSIDNVDIKVEVEGSKQLVLQSETTIIDPNKPFKPFGVTPTFDSAFLIGSKEIFSKTISDMTVHVEWQGLPFVSMQGYYNSYAATPPIGLNNDSFNADFEVLEDRKWESPTTTPLNFWLFDSEDDDGHPINPTGPVSFTNIFKVGSAMADMKRDPYMDDVLNYTLATKRGFARLVLKHTKDQFGSDAIIESFGHKEYPNILTDKVIQKNKSGGESVVLPNAPYTPVIKTISVDYVSEVSIPLNKAGTERDYRNRIEQFYNVDLFGYREVHPFTDDAQIYMFPQIDDEGALYMGISNLDPPQNLSLYYQLASGTANPSSTAPEVKFSMLRDNKWVELPSSTITLDSTNGLLRSGIIKLDLPQDISTGNSLINDGRNLFWVKAHVLQNSDAINKTFQINSQGITASFVNDGNDLNRLRTPLAPETITKLRFGDPAIKSVDQPFASFGGKVKEEANDFYTRVSERLRHKSRAVNIYDYERLVLENYPSVYRVKCLNHTKPIKLAVPKNEINSDGTLNSLSVIPSDAELAPGYVTVVLVADSVNQTTQDVLVPRISLDTITSVETFLSDLKSDFVILGAENPIYEQIILKFDVAFRTGLDRKYYTNLLNEDIKKFLSPWAFENPDHLDISFGGRIHKSVLIDFIEERPYVEIVSRFFMFQQLLSSTPITEEPPEATAVDEAVAHTSRSILVSSPTHFITAIDFVEASRECDAGGIGDMIIRVEDDNPVSGTFIIR